VGDIAPSIAESLWIAAARDEIINIGADVPCKVNELAHEVAAAMGVPEHPIEHLPQRNEVRLAYSDHSKAARVFGTHRDTSLRQGLERMAQWARVAGVRRGKAFEGVEVDRNMPPSWRRMMLQETD
jgi:UDP-glucose 4-epimerase